MNNPVRHNPDSVPAPVGGYSQGVETLAKPGARHLFVSGQIPEDAEGRVPDGFEAQCEQVWANLSAVLESAGMTTGDLVKVTTFLTDPSQAEANARVRGHALGDASPALTVVVVRTLDPQWLLEVEAVAAT